MAMSQPSKGQKNDLMVEVKSKFDAEFRRFAVHINEISTFEAFQAMLAEVHLLSNEKDSTGASHNGENLVKKSGSHFYNSKSL